MQIISSVFTGPMISKGFGKLVAILEYRLLPRDSLADLTNPEVVCACGLGFSCDSPLSLGTGLGSLPARLHLVAEGLGYKFPQEKNSRSSCPYRHSVLT